MTGQDRSQELLLGAGGLNQQSVPFSSLDRLSKPGEKPQRVFRGPVVGCPSHSVEVDDDRQSNAGPSDEVAFGSDHDLTLVIRRADQSWIDEARDVFDDSADPGAEGAETVAATRRAGTQGRATPSTRFTRRSVRSTIGTRS